MLYRTKHAVSGTFALLLPLLLNAQPVVENSSGERFETVCQALEAASPGDVVTITGTASIASDCAWTTPGITLRGAAGASIHSDGAWIISADDTVIENINLANSGLEVAARNLTLRGMRIHGAEVGIKTSEAATGTLTIEKSEIYGNHSNLQIGKIPNFILHSSYIHSATGDSVTAQAASVQIQGNRFVSNNTGADAQELVLSADSTTVISDNIFLKLPNAAAYPMIQYVAETDQSGALAIANNTFISEVAQRIPFIEGAGEGRFAATFSKNIFWGPGYLDPQLSANSGDNYFGEDDIFVDLSENDFRLAEGAPVNALGANLARSDSFPFVVASESATEATLYSAKAAQERSAAASVTGLRLQASSVTGATLLFNNVVTLAAPAPSTGTVVKLSTSNSSVAVPYSSTLTIRSGQTSGAFILRTLGSGSAKITATAGTSASATIAVGGVSLSRLAIQSTSVGGGLTLLSNRVEMTGPVATSTTISLRSSNPLVTVPSSVTIPTAASSNGFTIKAGLASSPVTATITASHASGSKTVNVTVMPVTLSKVAIVPATVAGGNISAVQLILNGPSPSGGLPVTLSSSNPGAYPIVTSLVIPAGKVEHVVLTRTKFVSLSTGVTINAYHEGLRKSAAVTVVPTGLNFITPTASAVRSRNSVSIRVQLNGPAPSGGFAVALSSSSSILPVPASVVVPAGQYSVTFSSTARAVSSSTTVTVRASAKGLSRSTTITVLP